MSEIGFLRRVKTFQGKIDSLEGFTTVTHRGLFLERP